MFAQHETLTTLGKLSIQTQIRHQVLRQQSHYPELASTFCLLVIRHYSMLFLTKLTNRSVVYFGQLKVPILTDKSTLFASRLNTK